MKRYLLLFATNIAVIVTLSVIASALGLNARLYQNGIDYQGLLLFCLFWGFGGAFISLQMSRWSAKMMLGVQVIDPERAGNMRWLIDMVHDHCRRAGLSVMPEVGVFESPDPNAFATGPSEKRALVAFSTGILESMSREGLAGVSAHEVSHIKNGDMVTMTLIQGVINAFIMFFARVIAFFVSQAVEEKSRELVRFLVMIGSEILLGILGMLVVSWFSRQREFRADAGSARVAGRESMISALKQLQITVERRRESAGLPETMAAFGINGKEGGLLSLLATHPPLAERIRALETMRS